MTRHRLSLGTLAIGLLAVFGCASGKSYSVANSTISKTAPIHDMRDNLARWSGGGMMRFPEPERRKFLTYVKETLLENKDSEPFYRSPSNLFLNHDDAYVWKFPRQPNQGYLVFLNPHTGMVPSAEHAWLYVTDLDGKVLERFEFDTGWRRYADGADYSDVGWLSKPVLIQKTRMGMGGDGPQKIYIGFDGLRAAVVRVEDPQGHLLPMQYCFSNYTVGPAFSPPTVERLQQILLGQNEVERIEALIWLAGIHTPPGVPGLQFGEPILNQERYIASIKSPLIASAIRKLRGDRDAYVSKLANTVAIGTGNFAH